MRYLKWKVDGPTPMYWCFLKAPCEMEFEFTGRLPGVLQFDSLWSFFCIEELEGLEEPSGTIKVPPPGNSQSYDQGLLTIGFPQ